MRRSLAVHRPVHLRLTMGMMQHGHRDPTLRFAGREAWWATRTPLGSATLHVSAEPGTVVGEAWGDGAEWVLDGLAGLVGELDDTSGFTPGDDPVGRLHRRMPGLRMGRSRAVFEAMLPYILAQKVTGKGSKDAYKALVRALGEPAPGPHPLRLQPEPAVLAALPYEDYHPFNVERERADRVRRAASRAGRLEESLEMGDADAWDRLTALPGIGRWTAAAVRQVAFGDPDAVMVGDYNLPSHVAWNLAGEPRADDDRMLELLEPYRGHRARVTRLLKAGGAKPPRYGPRLPVRNITRS